MVNNSTAITQFVTWLFDGYCKVLGTASKTVNQIAISNQAYFLAVDITMNGSR
jgi:hypothetical protein